MVWHIVILLGAAWFIQSILGYLQIKHFNKHFKKMRELGRVAIGKNKGKIRAGVVVLIAVDGNGNIIRVEKMKGVSVFARMKPVKGLEDKNILSIDNDTLKNFDKLTAKAIENAIENFRRFSGKGGEE